MIQFQQALGDGVGKIAFTTDWSDVQARIAQTFALFYEEPVPSGYYPHFNEVALRMTLLSLVPELDGMRKQVKGLMEDGFGALIADDLHIRSYAPAQRNQLLYALCLSLGFPTPSSARQARLLWEVKEVPVPDGRAATYSEHRGEADLHTDSQSYPMPEELFSLYVERAARCGGGASLFCSLPVLKHAMSATASGKAALEVLSRHAFPFHIPLGEAGGRGAQAVTLAPILGQQPAIRFRYDVLIEGFAAHPEHASAEARDAVELLRDTLEHRIEPLCYFLPDGAIALCDNHAMLHGRTRFEDPQRHLLRTRMSSKPVAVHITTMLQEQSFSQAVLG